MDDFGPGVAFGAFIVFVIALVLTSLVERHDLAYTHWACVRTQEVVAGGSRTTTYCITGEEIALRGQALEKAASK